MIIRTLDAFIIIQGFIDAILMLELLDENLYESTCSNIIKWPS